MELYLFYYVIKIGQYLLKNLHMFFFFKLYKLSHCMSKAVTMGTSYINNLMLIMN